MILHKTPKEDGRFLSDKNLLGNINFYVLARQAIYNYLLHCKEEFVLAPRYLAGGVYLPIIKSGKKIIYYDLNNKLEIDGNYLQLDKFTKDNVIIYYIHHYGLYIKSNIEYLQKLSAEGYHIIDDRALTLPSKHYHEFANATIYSLYKLLGLPYGAFINLKDNSSIDYHLDNNDNHKIERIMLKNLNFYSASYIKYLNGFWFRVINKIYGSKVNFNPIVESYWDKNNFQTNLNILKTVDYDKINAKRRELVQVYLNNLNQKYILSLHSTCYLNQSLIGLPIYAENPEGLHRYLISNGVHSFILKRSWWFDSSAKQWDIVTKHLLLPIHHYLEKKDILKVCNLINKI